MAERNLGYSAARYNELAGFDGDWRDSWWNQDFLELMARRLKLDHAHSLLDVGCGAGHWGLRLAALLASDASVVGVDHEAGFLDAARKRAEARGLDQSFEYREASGERLPFEDASFDVVTCQTVLMHVPDASAVLAEMIRVAKPGAWIVAAEPNNLVNSLVGASSVPAPAFPETLRILELDYICQKGKIALGQGDRSIGEKLPGIYAELGLQEIAAYKNDRCPSLYPPYDGPGQAESLEQSFKWIDAQVWAFGGKADTLKLFVAGGGDQSVFDELWELCMTRLQRFKADVAAERYYATQGFLHYVVCGRKPV